MYSVYVVIRVYFVYDLIYIYILFLFDIFTANALLSLPGSNNPSHQSRLRRNQYGHSSFPPTSSHNPYGPPPNHPSQQRSQSFTTDPRNLHNPYPTSHSSSHPGSNTNDNIHSQLSMLKMNGQQPTSPIPSIMGLAGTINGIPTPNQTITQSSALLASAMSRGKYAESSPLNPPSIPSTPPPYYYDNFDDHQMYKTPSPNKQKITSLYTNHVTSTTSNHSNSNNSPSHILSPFIQK